MDRPGVRKVPEGSGEQRKIEKTGCDVICDAQTTLAVKGYVKVKVTDGWTCACHGFAPGTATIAGLI